MNKRLKMVSSEQCGGRCIQLLLQRLPRFFLVCADELFISHNRTLQILFSVRYGNDGMFVPIGKKRYN